MRALFTRFYAQPYLLFLIAGLSWGGNAVASRLVVGHVSPMALTSLRWAVAMVALLVFARAGVVAAWPLLVARWRYALFMGTLGFTAFNALFYAAAHYSSAINISIIQGGMPAFVLIGGLLLFGERIGGLQALGVAITLLGIALLASGGDPSRLASLALNRGDVFMLIASVLYAGYILGLRDRPAVPGLAFFAAMAAGAFLTSLPLVAAEAALGQLQWPTPEGWLIVLYVGLFPSLISQVFFMRGVELIGPARAGLFMNLVPVFGALLAVAILGEPFRPYHAVALALVLGGIWVAERRKGT